MSEDSIKEACREIIEKIIEDPSTDVESLKKQISKKYKLNCLLRNTQILEHATPQEKELIREKLKIKKIRDISGVVVVSVMTPPLPCPGKCIYCPTSPLAPKSYLGNEPTTMRARMLNFDPYKQVSYRLYQLEITGHDTSKVEVIVMGGTFPAYSESFQQYFIKNIYDALNKKRSSTLEEAIKRNELSQHRCVSLTIETRPDYAEREHIDNMLSFGTTRVELGVQVLSSKLLKWIKRNHTLKDVKDSTLRLKDSALKVGYHIMPGFQDPKKDLKMFKKLFTDSDYRPDMLKIYPVLVIKGTELYEMWKRGEFSPPTTEEMIDMIARLLEYVPFYVRVMRINRDIPSYDIEDGIKKSNLRELVIARMNELGIKCREIRYREAGHVYVREGKKAENISIVVRKYRASKGTEYFVSAEDTENDILVGYLRLRFPYKPYRWEISKDDALVRELKVVGRAVPIGKKEKDAFQHRGIGKALLRRAEEIAKEKGKEMIHVISAVGTREYYKKLGYSKYGVYMSKKIE